MQHLNELHMGMVSKSTLERNKAQYKEQIEKLDKEVYQEYLQKVGRVPSKSRRECKQPTPIITAPNGDVKNMSIEARGV